MFSEDDWDIYKLLKKSLFNEKVVGMRSMNHFVIIEDLCTDSHYTNTTMTLRNNGEVNRLVDYDNISTMQYNGIEFRAYLEKINEYEHYPKGYCQVKVYIMFEYNGFSYQFCFNTNCEKLLYPQDNMKIRDEELSCYIKYIDILLQNEKGE